MNKKKVFLTILLSTLLALLVAFCMFKFCKKPKAIEETSRNDEVQIQTEIPQNSSQNKVVNEEIRTLQKVSNKTISKPTSKQTAQKAQEKQVGEQKISEEVFENKVEEKIIPQEDGVIVPVNYVSKNTYKYTYTPKRYPSRK